MVFEVNPLVPDLREKGEQPLLHRMRWPEMLTPTARRPVDEAVPEIDLSYLGGSVPERLVGLVLRPFIGHLLTDHGLEGSVEYLPAAGESAKALEQPYLCELVLHTLHCVHRGRRRVRPPRGAAAALGGARAR